MQGQLRQSPLEVEIHSTCAHSGQPIQLLVDHELKHRIVKGGPRPLVFEPAIDWSRFKDPDIIDGY